MVKLPKDMNFTKWERRRFNYIGDYQFECKKCKQSVYKKGMPRHKCKKI